MAFKNAMAHGPDYLGLKVVGPYMEPLFHNNGHMYEEIPSLDMNLSQGLVIYNQRAAIWAFKNVIAHGPVYML